MHVLHHINIFIHIIAGTIALCLGLLTATLYRDKKYHVRFGWWFVWMMGIVITTGLIGILAFGRNSFLLVITLLSGYNCFSGIRTLRLKGAKPKILDQLTPLIVLVVGGLYFYNLQSSALYWSPVVVYSTLGALLIITCYDLSKNWQGNKARTKTIFYEHAYKMISALSGLASAFAGTVFSKYQPYSQVLPSVIGLCGIFFIFVQLNHCSKHQSKQARVCDETID